MRSRGQAFIIEGIMYLTVWLCALLMYMAVQAAWYVATSDSGDGGWDSRLEDHSTDIGRIYHVADRLGRGARDD